MNSWLNMGFQKQSKDAKTDSELSKSRCFLSAFFLMQVQWVPRTAALKMSLQVECDIIRSDDLCKCLKTVTSWLDNSFFITADDTAVKPMKRKKEMNSWAPFWVTCVQPNVSVITKVTPTVFIWSRPAGKDMNTNAHTHAHMQTHTAAETGKQNVLPHNFQPLRWDHHNEAQ